MGKTLLMHDYIKAHPEHRFFVVEHANDWDEGAPHWRNEPPDNLVEFDDTLPDASEVEEAGVYVFRRIEPMAVAEFTCYVGNAVYVDDELDLTARRKGWDDSPLRRIVHQGRHLTNHQGEICEAHILGACRRPQNLHTDLTDIAEQTFIFKVQGSRTLKRLLDDSMIEDDQWDIIRDMPKFTFIHWPTGQFYKMKPIGDDDTKNERRPEFEADEIDDAESSA